MDQPVAGIDHAVVLVRDLDAARSAYQRLGFLTAPRGVQAEHVGTHGHGVVFQDDYVQLLGVRVPTALNERLRRSLEGRQGIHFVGLRTVDAGATVQALRERGVAAADPVTFSRPVDTPGGPAEAGFTLSLLPDEATPGVAMFACQHLTPEHVWLPELQRHPNTATGLDSITLVVDDIAAAAGPYTALFGAGSVTASERAATVATGGVPVELLTPAALAERYPAVDPGGIAPPAAVGLGVRVRDATAARVCLDDAGIVPVELGNGAFCIRPRETCGVVIEFRA